MSDAALKPASQIELELPDDPRVTPLVRRLATEYWEIVQTQAEHAEFPILRAWMDIYVDTEGFTWFPVTVHCPLTFRQAWDFQRSITPYSRPWYMGLTVAERDMSTFISTSIVGLQRDRRTANGA